MADERRDVKTGSENRDPLSGEAGAHPVGTGLGAAGGGLAGGAAAGAAIGSVAGPVGTAIGAAAGVVVGAVAGGLAGKGVAESIDPTLEHAHWEKNYTSRPYYESGHTYDDYRPAYQYGLDARAKHAGRSFDEVETDLSRDWDRTKSNSRLNWDKAKGATRDAWDRVSSR